MSHDRVPPPTRLPSLITTPMSWGYSLVIGRRNRAFDAGRGVTELDRVVISIGNLSTGGTGKTPMVHAVVRMLQEGGHRPVIAMRGYGARPGLKGDEQLEHEEALAGVPIVAQPDRRAGLRALFAREEGEAIDCVVLDDGFQHRRIARDLDIVLIDSTRPPDRDAMLPRGHLRDPVGSLSRAQLVVLTHAERVDAGELERLRALVARHAPGVPVIVARHEWSTISAYERTEQGWNENSVTLADLADQSVRVVCGIGNSDTFLAMVRDYGMRIEQHVELADHQAMSVSVLGSLTSTTDNPGGAPILMTRKDWVKAREIQGWPSGSSVYVPVLSMKFDDPGLLRDALLDACARG